MWMTQPTPIVKLPQAHEYAQLLSNLAVERASEFSVVDAMNMQSFMDALNKMSFSNINIPSLEDNRFLLL